jgi:hypothetical protein
VGPNLAEPLKTAIFVALAIGLTAFCFWWIRRRIT